MSTSGDEDFARWAAQPTRSRLNDSNRQIYIFTLKVWRADLIPTSIPEENLIHDFVHPELIIGSKPVSNDDFYLYRGRDY